MSTALPPEEIVHQSALQLWAAAQTDFDPYEVPPGEWKGAVAITEADIATDTGLTADVVRDCLKRLDGTRLVVADDGGTLSVTSIVPGDAPL
jgi:hypothetical protein